MTKRSQDGLVDAAAEEERPELPGDAATEPAHPSSKGARRARRFRGQVKVPGRRPPIVDAPADPPPQSPKK
jgi:hypothetical protein